MFWHEVSDAAAPPAETEKPSVTKDAAQLAGLLKENALPLTEARKLAKELFGRKRGDAAYEELISKLSDYGVVIAATGISTQKVIGSEKSVENAISTLRGKHLQDVAVKFGKTSQG